MSFCFTEEPEDLKLNTEILRTFNNLLLRGFFEDDYNEFLRR